MFLIADIIEKMKQGFNVFLMLDLYGWIIAIIEVMIIYFVIYNMFLWFQNTDYIVYFRGFAIIIAVVIISTFFQFDVILTIMNKLWYPFAIALVVVFQSEIRKAVEDLGRRTNYIFKFIPNFNKLTKKSNEGVVQEIVEAAFAMGNVKTGALIVIENHESLEEIEKTGIAIDGKVSKQLLINIFEKNTPLHDGAVLIVGGNIKAATCYLPLSKNPKIPKDLGTRHRAALGISEISDSQIVVVSEETGHVSICSNGKIKIVENKKDLIKELLGIEEKTIKEKNDEIKSSEESN